MYAIRYIYEIFCNVVILEKKDLDKTALCVCVCDL